MTGRDMVIYILTNELENEPMFKDGKFMGFMSVGETAVKMGVGVSTVYTWIFQNRIDYVKIGDTYLVPANCELIMKDINE